MSHPVYKILKEHQWESSYHLAKLLDSKSALDASDTGIGKTYMAAGAMALLGNVNVGVICPKSIKHEWIIVLNLFGITPIFVETWEKMRRGGTQWLKKSISKDRHGNNLLQWVLPTETFVILDEVHKARNPKTATAKIIEAMIRCHIRGLALSATFAVEFSDLRYLGQLIGLHNGSDYYEWMISHGHSYVKGSEFIIDIPFERIQAKAKEQLMSRTFHGIEAIREELERDIRKENLLKLNKEIFPACGVRLSKDELRSKGLFPQTDIAAISYEVDPQDAKTIRDIYSKMNAEIDRLKVKMEQDYEKGTAAEALVFILRARQKVELHKCPLLADLAHEGFEAGSSVIVFVNFMDSLLRLQELLPGSAVVHGQQNERERRIAIEDFQENRVGCIIVNSAAGGASISLHDKYNKHPRISYICPSWSPITLMQCLGRPDRSGGSDTIQRLVYVANTIEEDQCKAVKPKLENIDTINDGDLTKGVKWL